MFVCFGREESYLWFRWFQAILLYYYLTYPSAVSTCVCHGTQCQKLQEISRGMLWKIHNLKWFMTNITSLEIDRTFFWVNHLKFIYPDPYNGCFIYFECSAAQIVSLRLKCSLFNSISLTIGSRIWKFLLRTTNLSYFFFLVTCFCTAGTITLNTSIASVIQWFFNLFVYSSLQHLCRTEGVHWSLSTCGLQVIFDFTSLMILHDFSMHSSLWKNAIWFGLAQNKILFVSRFFRCTFQNVLIF